MVHLNAEVSPGIAENGVCLPVNRCHSGLLVICYIMCYIL